MKLEILAFLPFLFLVLPLTCSSYCIESIKIIRQNYSLEHHKRERHINKKRLKKITSRISQTPRAIAILETGKEYNSANMHF